ncbi:MAG: hypothetical protein EOP53_06405 [Sphingobacteriales bacterium]|nr:MAG: hypothetical protein EOP53_06405 [Sphingobacteriales bacterium]
MELLSTQARELNAFLLVYFLDLENFINSNTTELKQIKFQSEEANTDEFIKRHFKQLILSRNTIDGTSIRKVCFAGTDEEQLVDVNNLLKYKITGVYLPEELTPDQRSFIAKRKNAVYTQPDLLLQIEGGEEIHFESLELKSTKTNNIPGSSVQQVSPLEWVIFVKRGEQQTTVSTGQYINSITERLPFPDRSPRPQVGFNTLLEWNQQNRVLQNNVLTVTDNPALTLQKIKLLQDWQDYLASEWMTIIQSAQVKAGEKWFNNTLRKFAIKFLEFTNELSEEDRNRLLLQLNSLLKK